MHGVTRCAPRGHTEQYYRWLGARDALSLALESSRGETRWAYDGMHRWLTDGAWGMARVQGLEWSPQTFTMVMQFSAIPWQIKAIYGAC